MTMTPMTAYPYLFLTRLLRPTERIRMSFKKNRPHEEDLAGAVISIYLKT